MKLSDFCVGLDFWSDNGRWCVTDVGSRTVVAIRVDSATMGWKEPDGQHQTREIAGEDAERIGWFDGPPYRVVERVFDEDDREGCTLTKGEQP